jgi:hypothetical protein
MDPGLSFLRTTLRLCYPLPQIQERQITFHKHTRTTCKVGARDTKSHTIDYIVTMAQAQGKAESEMIENTTTAAAEDMSPPDAKGGTPLMRSKEDNIGVWQSVRRYKRVGLIAMAAAFCASLDGYRKAFLYFDHITSFIHP